MKKYLNFKIIINQDEDGVFVASCPAIPGCHSQGDTYENAVEHVKEAIILCLKVAQDDREFRDSIDFGQENGSHFIAIRDVMVPQPQYV